MSKRLLRALVALATALVLTATAVSPALGNNDDPNRGRYAAVGDSYAAGVGVGTESAYPALLAGATNKVNFLATSGATTTDVLMEQVNRITPGVRQVTVTVGGNDVGFVEVMLACAAGYQTTECQTALGGANAALAELPGNLQVLLAAIRDRAPRATIYVTNYPLLFQTVGETYTCETLDAMGFPYDGFALAVADFAIALGVTPAVEGAVAAMDDPDIVFVNVGLEFLGRGMCNPDGYITPPSFIAPGVPHPSSLHPNEAGQLAYARAIADAGFSSPAFR